MEVRPVSKNKRPVYPNKAQIEDNLDLLNVVPERWKHKSKITAALASLLIISFTGCSKEGSEAVKPNSNIPITTNPNINVTTNPNMPPIFQHGAGRGSFGCVSVASPVFLSEEEALQVIKEEAKKEGLDFGSESTVLNNIKIPITTLSPGSFGNNGNKFMKTKEGDLKLDGFNPDMKIGFEFLSKSDYLEWLGEDDRATVETFYVLTAAETLRNSIGENADGKIIGVFYEPLEEYNSSIDEKLKADLGITSKSSEELLRKQVRDFLKWLKAQNII